METVSALCIEWGVASVPLPGQIEAGDRHVVCSFPGGVLLAAIDGLGHGEEAAVAAKATESVLRAWANEPVISLVQRCHESLRQTRGVVMSIASLDTSHGLMTWIGVGNVRGVLCHSGFSPGLPPEELLLRAGVVGAQIPPLQAAVIPVSYGDILFLVTDGIRGDFSAKREWSGTPQRVAEAILSGYAKGNDDGLVLVARCLGSTL
jgi:negative regulator of sigma-B (phosphoserine phosphatase)